MYMPDKKKVIKHAQGVENFGQFPDVLNLVSVGKETKKYIYAEE